MKKQIIKLFVLMVTSCTLTACSPFFHEPTFKGTLLDKNTKQPIEGAVVMAVYHKRSMGMGAGQYSSIINIRETLTEKDGSFRIPSYTTLLLLPFTWQDYTMFLLYKPGYASLEWPLKEYFTGEEIKEREISPWRDPILGKYKVILRGPGIVELPEVTTRDERQRSMPSHPDEMGHFKEQKTLIRLINEERKYLGEKELDPYKLRDFILNMGKGHK
jgi:hypothetical protein